MRSRALIWILAAIAVGAAARSRLDVVEVRGDSMSPTLLAGDRILVVRAPPRPGDVVLAPDPRDAARELVKRVAGARGDDVELRGDNAVASTDARVARASVQWRAVLRYWPPARATTQLGRVRPLELVDQGGEPACAVPEALIAGS